MIRIRKGLNIPITGVPDQKISNGNAVNTAALLGMDYVGLKPTMAVNEGDTVQAGELLFTDKKTAGIRFTAPVSGRVTAVNRGDRRVLQSVVIERDGKESVQFSTWPENDLSTLSQVQVVEQLVQSGLWCALRTRPYSKVPAPESEPHSIFVTAMDTQPLAADPEVIIKHYKPDFTNGLKVLQHLTKGVVYLCAAPGADIPADSCRLEIFSGPHPAGLPGTHIHFLDPVSTKKTVWYIGYQDVIAIGRLFVTGQLWQERIVALTGPQVRQPRLVKTCPGASLKDLLVNEVEDNENRVISGSVLAGRNARDSECYLGRYHHQVSVLREGVERSLLHYFSPGLRRFSIMPVYLSHLFKRKFPMTTAANGSLRAMVPVGSYEQVMPLDILPTQLLRALIVSDIEMAEGLGMLELDEEDLALCTFVCPGKYEYGPILRDNLMLMEKEG